MKIFHINTYKLKLAAVAILAIPLIGSITSCKKDYTCKCDKTYTGSGGSTTSNYAVYTYKDNLPDAESKCDANEKTDSDLGGAYTINCRIDD